MRTWNDNFLIGTVKGAKDDIFKIASFDVEEGKVWVIVDKYGNIVTPFFEGTGNAISTSEYSCVVLGKERKSKNKFNKLYLATSFDDPDDHKCKKVTFPIPIKYMSYVDNKTLLFLTTEGLCFVDSRSLKQKSDFYDALYYCNDPKVKSWIYEKTILSDNSRTVLTGLITTDGKIGEKTYDVLFHRERKKDDMISHVYDYDVIDGAVVVDALKDREISDSIKKQPAIKKLAKTSKNS